MEFKDRIKLLREENMLTHSQVAAWLGKSEGAIRSWEMGRSKPDLDTLIEVADKFNCTADYLLGLSDFKDQQAFDINNQALLNLAKALSKSEAAEGIIEDLNLILQSPYHLIAEAREGDDAEDIVIVSDSVTQCCRIVIAMMARASGSAVNFTQDNDATILSYSNFVRDLEFKLNGAIGATAAFFGELCQYVSENASRLIKDDNDAALIRNIFESFFGRLDVVRLKNDMNIS